MTVTINEVRKYWDDRPCNVRHSKKEIGTTEYFDEVENLEVSLITAAPPNLFMEHGATLR